MALSTRHLHSSTPRVAVNKIVDSIRAERGAKVDKVKREIAEDYTRDLAKLNDKYNSGEVT